MSAKILNEISIIEDGVVSFYCNDNMIAKIENLPDCIDYFDCSWNGIEFNLRDYQCIRRFQKRFKRWYRILENNTPSGRLESILMDKTRI